ncbi:MAG: RHS repeat protein, partial [Alphaproteobacteria bacterium]|nr:RHS repeat protein [Alphaproteobacteria bacterium]
MAIKADADGQLLEIAHIITGAGSPSLPGVALTKGGGAGAEPQNYTSYNPSNAADVLKAKFIDRSNLFGVDLSNGSVGYTSPIALRIGNGGFPYELSASLSWHPGAREPGWTLLSPIAPQSGWVHSWSNSLSLSGSTLEALGQSDIRGAVGAIVAFYATQDIYGHAASAERDVAAILTQAWWAHQLSGNVATVNIGGKTRQFIKLANAEWILPGSDYATLNQTGSRVAFEQKCFYQAYSEPPYALARGWDNSSLSFSVTNAHGDKQNFEYFETPYHTDQKHKCGHLTGFRLKNWTFPYGVTVTPTYDQFMGGEDGNDPIDYLKDVHNSVSRKLAFSVDGGTIDNGLAEPDKRAISFTQDFGGTSKITDVLTQDTNFTYVGPYNTATPTQRPVPYHLLNLITAPGAAKQAEYDYDSLGHVHEVKDAVALLPDSTRNPYRFYIADGTRGERVDPLNQNYVVEYDTYGHPSRYRDELGHETASLFDSRGRVMQYVYPEGDCERFDYDPQNNTVSYKRIDKVSSCNPNAGSGHVLSAAASYDQTWNKPLTIKNFGGKTTTLTYYDDNETGASLLHTAKRPIIAEGQPVYTFAYTNIGKVDTSTGPTGIVTQNNYEPSGSRNLLSTVVDPGTGTHLNLATAFGYDAQGDVTLTVDPRANATTSTYELDRLKKQEEHHKGGQGAALNAASRTFYDLLRRDYREDVALTFSGANVTSWQANKWTTYTATSKVETVKDADNRITTTKYDDDDRVLTISDPEDRKTHFVYCAPGDANCAANQVAIELRAWGGNNNHCSVSDGLQQCYRRLTYGADGEQLSLQDANGNITAYGYDDFLRLTKTTFPDSSYEQLTLDSNDNVTARRNRAGETLTYQYNDLDWIVQKTSPNPAVTDYWTYLLDGRIDTL